MESILIYVDRKIGQIIIPIPHRTKFLVRIRSYQLKSSKLPIGGLMLKNIRIFDEVYWYSSNRVLFTDTVQWEIPKSRLINFLKKATTGDNSDYYPSNNKIWKYKSIKVLKDILDIFHKDLTYETL